MAEDRQYNLRMGLDTGAGAAEAALLQKHVDASAAAANRAQRELAGLGKTSSTYASTTKTATSSVAGLVQGWTKGGSSAAAYSTGAGKAAKSTEAWTAAGRGAAGQLGAVSTSADRATASAHQYKSATEQVTDASNRSTASMGKLASGVIATVTAYVGMGQAIAIIRTGSQAAEDWSRSMLQVSTLADVSRETVQGWEGALKSLVTETGRAPNELSASILRVTSAGQRGAEAMDVVTSSSQAAAIGLGRVDVIAQAVTAAMNAYGPEVLSAGKATDILLQTVIEGAAEADTLAPALSRVIPIAAQLGVGFAEVGGFMATFTRLGGDANEASTALRATLNSMLGPEKQQTEALATIGLSMADLRKEITEKGLAKGLVDLLKLFKGNEDALSAVFPNIRALTGVLATAGSQGEQFAGIQDNITNSTGAMHRKFLELQDNPAFRAEQARAGWALFQQELGGPVLGAVLDVGDAIKDSLGGDAVSLGRKVGEEIAAGIELAKPFIVFLISNLRLIRDATLAWLTLKVAQWIAEAVSGLAVLVTRLLAATAATAADTAATGANTTARVLSAGANALVAEKMLLYESANIRATITTEAATLAAGRAAVAGQLQSAAAVELTVAQKAAQASTFYLGNTISFCGEATAAAGAKLVAYEAATVSSTLATEASALAAGEAALAEQAQAVAATELATAQKAAATEAAFFSTSLTAMAVGLAAVVGALLIANSAVKQFGQDAEDASVRMVNAVQKIGQEANKIRIEVSDLMDTNKRAIELQKELLKAGVAENSPQGKAIQLRLLSAAQGQYVEKLYEEIPALKAQQKAAQETSSELYVLAGKRLALEKQIDENIALRASQNLEKEEVADLTVEFARLSGELAGVKERASDVGTAWTFHRDTAVLLEKNISDLTKKTHGYKAPAEQAAAAAVNFATGTDKASAAAKKAQAEHDRLAASLRALKDAQDPLGAENRKYAETQADIARGVTERIFTESEASVVLKQLAKDHADAITKILADLAKLKAADAQKIWADLFPPVDGVTVSIAPAFDDSTLLKNGDSWERLNEEIRESGIGVQELNKETRTFGSIAKDAAQNFGDGVTYALGSFVRGILDGEANLEDLWDGLLDVGKDALAQILSEWIVLGVKQLAIWVKTELAKTAVTLQQAAIRNAADGKYGPTQNGGNIVDGVGGATGAGGGTAGAGAGAGAAALGTVAVFAVIYFGVSSWIRSHRREWAELTVSGHGAVSTLGSKNSVNSLLGAMSEFMDGIRSFVKSVGGEFVSLQKDVTVGSRGQGKNKSYYVKLAGEVLADFGNDIEAALEFAAITALKNSETRGLSPLVKEAIQKSLQTTVEGFQKEIALFAEIANLGVPDAVVQVRATTAHLDELREALVSLNSITPAVIEGFANLQAAELLAWQSSRDALTGQERTAAQDLQLRQAQGVMWNAELQVRRTSLALTILEIKARIALAQVQQGRGGSGGAPGRASGDPGNAAGGPSQAVLVFANSMIVTGQVALTTASVMTGAANAQLEALNAQLAALQALQIALDAIPFIDPTEIIPRGGGGTGGPSRADDLKTLHDIFKQFDLSKLSDFEQRMREINDRWDEAEKLARGNAHELDEINRRRREEIALLRKQTTEALYGRIKDFEKNPFKQSGFTDAVLDVQDNADKLREDFEKTAKEMGWGAERIAKGLKRITDAEERHLRFLSQQGFAELAGNLAGLITDDKVRQDLLRAQEIVTFQLQMMQYRAQYEVLKALGFLTDAQLGVLDAAFKWIDDNAANLPGGANWDPFRQTAPPDTNTGSGSGGTNVNPFESLEEFRKELEDQIREWTVSALGPFNREATDLRDRFANLTAEAARLSAITGTSLIPELERLSAAYQAAVGNFVDNALADFEDLGESDLIRESRELTERFDDIRQSFITIGASAEQFARLADAERRAFANLWREATSDLRDLVDDLRANDPRVSSQLRYSQAQAEFRSLLARAQGGDIEAASQLGAAGQRYREESLAFLGQGVGSNRVIDEILRAGSIIDGMTEAMDPVATRVDISNRYLEGIYGALTGGAGPLLAAVTGSTAKPSAAALGLLGIREAPQRGATPVAGFSPEIDFARSLSTLPRTGLRKPAEGGGVLEEALTAIAEHARSKPAKEAADTRRANAETDTLDDIKLLMADLLVEQRATRAELRKWREAGKG